MGTHLRDIQCLSEMTIRGNYRFLEFWIVDMKECNLSLLFEFVCVCFFGADLRIEVAGCKAFCARLIIGKGFWK